MKLKYKLVTTVVTMMIVVMILSLVAVSVILNELNHENAENVILDTSFKVNEILKESRQGLASTSQQIAHTKSIFGIMIYLIQNRPRYELNLMRFMYRYYTEAILNITKSAGLFQVIIYDLSGVPIAFCVSEGRTVTAGYIHSFSNGVGESISLKRDDVPEDGNWQPLEYPDSLRITHRDQTPVQESIRLELLKNKLQFTALVPIAGDVYDTKTKSMKKRQLGFVEATQFMGSDRFERIELLSKVKIDQVREPGIVRDMLSKKDRMRTISREGQSDRISQQLYLRADRLFDFNSDHMGIQPVFQENSPLFLFMYTYGKSEEMRRIVRLLKVLGLVFGICILLVVPILVVYANSITQPISNVVNGLKNVAVGNNDPFKLRADTKDEIGELVDGFNVFAAKIIHARNRLKRLSGKIIESQERERALIARELHDELGQILTALRINSVWISNRLKSFDLQASRRADEMKELIDKSIDEVRHIALKLRPRILDDLGLDAAVDWLVTDFEKRTGISCALINHVDVKVSDNTAVTIYRIVQEALSNIARHSRANRASVALAINHNYIELTISDNGIGFSENDSVRQRKGLGVSGIKERVTLLDGKLDIVSEPGNGASLFCSLPLLNENHENNRNDKDFIG